MKLFSLPRPHGRPFFRSVSRLIARGHGPRALSLIALLLTAGPAAAQEVAAAKSVNSIGGVMLSLLMLVGVIIVSFMSPRRGPQE